MNGSHEFVIKGYSLTNEIGIWKYIVSETCIVFKIKQSVIDFTFNLFSPMIGGEDIALLVEDKTYFQRN